MRRPSRHLGVATAVFTLVGAALSLTLNYIIDYPVFFLLDFFGSIVPWPETAKISISELIKSQYSAYYTFTRNGGQTLVVVLIAWSSYETIAESLLSNTKYEKYISMDRYFDMTDEENPSPFWIAKRVLIGAVPILCIAYFAIWQYLLPASREIIQAYTSTNASFLAPKLFYIISYGIFGWFLRAWFITLPLEKLAKLPQLYREGRASSIVRSLMFIGRGGSSSWGDVATLKNHEAQKVATESSFSEGIKFKFPIFGRTMTLDDNQPRLLGMGVEDHIITIGIPGSGKSTTVLYPNLAVLDCSLYVYDPKGEISHQTLGRRTRWHKETYELRGNAKKHLPHYDTYLYDPLEATDGRIPRSYFNPLHLIDLNSDKVASYLAAIADSLFPEPLDSNSTSKYFNDSAKAFLRGLIVYVMNTYEPQHHTLSFIYDLVLGKFPDDDDDPELSFSKNLATKLAVDDARPDDARRVGLTLGNKSDNELSGFIETFVQGLEWAGDPRMRKSFELATPTRTFGDLKYEDMQTTIFGMNDGHTYPYRSTSKSVYYVLPTKDLSVYYPWIRLFISLSLKKEQDVRAENNDKSELLFIIDEYYQLKGRIPEIQAGFPIFRGMGIRLWLIFQSLPQARVSLGDDWKDKLAASAIQVIAATDPETLEYVSKRLGSSVKHSARDSSSEGKAQPLMTPEEVGKEFSKVSMKQIVFFTDGIAVRLHRHTYMPLIDRDTGKSMGSSFDDINLSLKGHFEDY